MKETKLGELLIESKVITPEQFNLAFEMQRLHPDKPIGQLLCSMGFLSREDLEHTLDNNKKRRKLGEILVAQNLINEERLDSALKISQSEKVPLGKILIKQRLVGEEQLARAIASQYDLQFVNLAIKLRARLSAAS